MTAPAAPTGFAGVLARNRKALTAGATWAVSFVAAVLVISGQWPTVEEWVIAIAGTIPAGAVTYLVPNAKPKPPTLPYP